eukprot:TRINITY_DN9175_c0_g1_i1.p1 TRINITY_DN9175_c0_g1~~TRINITY_DN9175_c0_g1_i1.p1  ORF type:complete len:258 (+),score=27.89 TRINITY_DN9175_c0_g1_i1:57-830(+)
MCVLIRQARGRGSLWCRTASSSSFVPQLVFKDALGWVARCSLCEGAMAAIVSRLQGRWTSVRDHHVYHVSGPSVYCETTGGEATLLGQGLLMGEAVSGVHETARGSEVRWTDGDIWLQHNERMSPQCEGATVQSPPAATKEAADVHPPPASEATPQQQTSQARSHALSHVPSLPTARRSLMSPHTDATSSPSLYAAPTSAAPPPLPQSNAALQLRLAALQRDRQRIVDEVQRQHELLRAVDDDIASALAGFTGNVTP